jgi:AAA domain
MQDGYPALAYLPSPRLGERLFYARSVGLIAGHKKSMKSWATVLLAGDMMESGNPVLYVDRENGGRVFARRMLDSGATIGQVRDLFHYVPFPSGMPVDELEAEIAAWAAIMPAGLLIYDSLRTLLGAAKLSSNSDTDIELALGPIMRAVKNQADEGQFAALIIDHANRATRASDLFAHGGSQAKSAAVDTTYYVEKLTEVSKDVQGTVMLEVKDDREGDIPDRVRYFAAGGQGHGKPLYWERTDAPAPEAAEREVLAMQAAQWVREQDDPQARKAIAEGLGVEPSGSLDRALAHAVKQEWLEHPKERGPYSPGRVEPVGVA